MLSRFVISLVFFSRVAIEQCTKLPASFLTHAEDTRILKEFHLWLTYNRELLRFYTSSFSIISFNFSQRVEVCPPYRKLTEYTALNYNEAHSVSTNSKLLSTEVS